MNKRGSIIAIFSVIVVLIMLGLGLYFGGVVSNNIFNELDNTNYDNNSNQVIDKYSTGSIPLFDTIFLICFFGAFIGLIVTGVYLQADPIVLVLFLVVLLVFGTIIAMFATDLFSDVDTQVSPHIEGGANPNKIIGLMGGSFPIILIIGIVIFLLVLYAKRTA